MVSYSHTSRPLSVRRSISILIFGYLSRKDKTTCKLERSIRIRIQRFYVQIIRENGYWYTSMCNYSFVQFSFVSQRCVVSDLNKIFVQVTPWCPILVYGKGIHLKCCNAFAKPIPKSKSQVWAVALRVVVEWNGRVCDRLSSAGENRFTIIQSFNHGGYRGGKTTTTSISTVATPQITLWSAWYKAINFI